jgi:hypothetical protein
MGRPQTTFKKRLKEMKRKEKLEKKQQRRLEKKGAPPEEPIVRKRVAPEPETPMIQLGSEEAKALLAEKKKARR